MNNLPTTPYILLTPTLGLGGAERQFVAMARHVPGCQAIVVRHDYVDNGIRTELYKMGIRHFVNTKNDPSKTRGDINFLLQKTPNAIVVTWGIPDLPQVIDEIGPRPKVILISQNSCELQGQKEWIENCLVGSPIYFVAVSRAAAEPFGMHSPDDYAVIPNMVDEEHLKTSSYREHTRDILGVRDDQKLILWLGRFCRQKNPIKALNIAQCLPESYKLLMVGPRCQMSLQIEQMARSPSHPFRGKVGVVHGVDDPGGLLAAADCLLVTSNAEGLPTNVIEALSLGVPVVMPELGCTKDLLGLPDTVPKAKEGFSDYYASRIKLAISTTNNQTKGSTQFVVNSAWGSKVIAKIWSDFLARVAKHDPRTEYVPARSP